MTIVRVTMSMHPFIAAFTAFWLGMVATGFVAALRGVQGDPRPALITAGMFAFGLGLAAVCFYAEARKARRILEEGVRGRS
jgi:hypothetical protein